jgi:hypothetical protein
MDLQPLVHCVRFVCACNTEPGTLLKQVTLLLYRVITNGVSDYINLLLRIAHIVCNHPLLRRPQSSRCAENLVEAAVTNWPLRRCVDQLSDTCFREATCREFSMVVHWSLLHAVSVLSESRDSSVGIALGYGLLDRGSRVRFPAGAGNFSLHHCVQNGSGAHPASYPMGTRRCFRGSKAAGAWSWPLTSI